MLKEYALHPALLSNWQTCRFLVDKFGYGRGRVISRYPKAWARMVYDSLNNERPIEKARIVEALTRFKAALYSRPYEWNVSKAWTENALDEHAKRPFNAIVTGNEDIDHEAIIKEAALDEAAEPRWKAERQRHVGRTAAEMAACANVLLRNAKQVLFVDPHFNPQLIRFRRPLKLFLEIIADRLPAAASVIRVEIHCGDRSAGVKSFFDGECIRQLPRIIPRGIRVRLVRWEQGYLHNRFILTESGGLKFSIGLDDQDSGNVSHDLVDLLEPDPYTRTWSEYQCETPVFPLLENDLVIDGSA